jgi:hypothetical protein
MKKMTLVLAWLLACPLFLAETVYTQEILVNTQEGDIFVLDIDSSESFGMLEEKITALSEGKKNHWLIEYSKEGQFKTLEMHARNQGGYLGYPRNYLTDVTPEEKNDIRFIVTTLANKSLIAIALSKPELEQAGDRIDHIHPLRFLMTVFTDEELKVGIRNIRGKGWVWNHFLGGLREALSTETQIGNMKEDYIQNFSKIVSINPILIQPAILHQKWDDFVDLLITNIPRKGDHDRYEN